MANTMNNKATETSSGYTYFKGRPLEIFNSLNDNRLKELCNHPTLAPLAMKAKKGSPKAVATLALELAQDEWRASLVW